MTSRREDRMRMPGEERTDEDLRLDAELTREELAETVAALGAKADVKARVRERADAIRTSGTVLVDTLPDPVAKTVRPVWLTVSGRPAIPVGGLAVLLAALLIWRRARKH